MRNWNAAFEISSATGQTEAVLSGAGIGILHDYIARQYPELVRILPDISDPAGILDDVSRKCA